MRDPPAPVDPYGANPVRCAIIARRSHAMKRTPTALRLLLVEDDADYRELLSDYLTSLGHSVVEFSSAEDALRHVTESTDELPGLVLTDMRMQRTSGMELARTLRRAHPHLPIILMTAFGERQLAQDAIRLGCSAYVEKPFRLADLATEIERMVPRAAD